MNIVIDEKIPFLKQVLEKMGHNVLAKPGVEICAADVKEAQALFVRTRTKCGASLLHGSKVRFVGTATSGYDHIDSGYCAANGIVWANAAGCNSGAVLQYIQSVLYAWSKIKNRSLEGLVLGVVGVGEIGSKVAAWAHEAGMRVLLNDPPRERRDGPDGFVPLSRIAEECDIVTFHPTLNPCGEFKTYHLAGPVFFSSLRRCLLLVNASRGPVVDNAALKAAIESGVVGDAVLDVWEGEPDIDVSLLNKVFVGTPHIAGYSLEGKMNATRLVLEAFASFTGFQGELPLPELAPPAQESVVASSLSAALLDIYDPLKDCRALKENPAAFEELRNNYALRREPVSYKLCVKNVGKC